MHRATRLPFAFLAIFASTCQLDEPHDKPEESNRVSYEFDGAPVPVDQATAIAYFDDTKQLLGPNTHLLFVAGPRSSVTFQLDAALEINLPRGTIPGTYPVRYKPMPGKSDVWVSYYEPVTGKKWTAYSGMLTVQSIGEVGGRLRLHFGELRLSNPCGEEHVLNHGEVDVRIGSEDGWAQSEFYTPPGEPDDHAAELENNVVLELDRVFACPYANLFPSKSSGDDPISMLGVTASCICMDPTFPEGVRSFLGVLANLPLSDADAGLGHDLLFVDIDVEQTPYDLDDDELWLGLRTPEFTFDVEGATPGDAIDITAVGPIPMAYFIRGDEPYINVSRIKMLTQAKFYGFVENE